MAEQCPACGGPAYPSLGEHGYQCTAPVVGQAVQGAMVITVLEELIDTAAGAPVVVRRPFYRLALMAVVRETADWGGPVVDGTGLHYLGAVIRPEASNA